MIAFLERMSRQAFTRPILFFGTFFLVFTASHLALDYIFSDLTSAYVSLSSVALFLLTPWVLLALVAAFGDAGVGYIDEWLLEKLSKENGKEVDAPGRLLLISGFFGFVISIGALIASLMLGGEYSLNVPTSSMLLAMAAGVLEVTWMIFYFNGLERGGALNATPLFQSIPIFSLIFGLALFSEIPTATQIIAVLFFVIGAAMLNYTPETKKLDWVTISLILTASAIISLGFFLFKDAALTGNFVASLFGNGLGMGLCSLLVWSIWPPYRHQFGTFVKSLRPRVLFMQLGNEGLYAVSTIASQLAIVLGPSVMVVSAFNAFHPIFTLMIGGVLAVLGSRDHQESFAGSQIYTKTAAIILIAAGAAIIAL